MQLLKCKAGQLLAEIDGGYWIFTPTHGKLFYGCDSEKAIAAWRWVHRDIYAATPHFPLDFRIRIYYNIRMKNKSSKKSRSRAEILAEIAALPPSVQGTISSYRCPRKNGPPAVYHNLQYTRGGKNHSFSIPVDKVSEFKAAVAAGRKLRDLVFELSLADANEIASSESPLKKNSRSSS